MSESPNLNLPYLLAAQAQKHVTHNEALDRLDAVVQLSVLSSDLTDPPLSPQIGDRYIVAPGATGDWSDKDGQLTGYFDGQWQSYVPSTGWICWDIALSELRVWDGVAWTNGMPLAEMTAKLGINGAADVINRLSVSSSASLFNHDGDDHQLKINKNMAPDTASLLFQTGFAGHAELGLMADNNFRLKVSPDGTGFLDALVVDHTTGSVSFPCGTTAVNNPNLLTNGDFSVAQRGSSFAGLTGWQYHLDRWISFFRTDYTISQIAIDHSASNAPEGAYALRRQRNSGSSEGTAYLIDQAFTSKDVKKMRGKYLTFSGKARRGSDFGALLPLGFNCYVGTGPQGVRGQVSYIGETELFGPLQIVITDTNEWVDWSVTTTTVVPAGATQMTIDNLFYPTSTGGTSAAGNNEWIDIADVKLELGDFASKFVPKLDGEEIARCQRYYARTAGSLRFNAASGAEVAENAAYWPSQMIAVPNVSILSAGSRSNVSGVGALLPTEKHCRFFVEATAAGDTFALGDLIEADGEI